MAPWAEETFAVVLGASDFPEHEDFQGPGGSAFKASSIKFIDCLGKSFGKDWIRSEQHFLDLFDSELSLDQQVERLGTFMVNIKGNDARLIIYYVGHGAYLSDREYYLALRCTAKRRERTSGLTSKALADAVSENYNGTLYMILDCCFAGAMVSAFQVADITQKVDDDTFKSFHDTGTSLLCACSKNEVAFSKGNGNLTQFSECLTDIFEQGISGKDQWLTLRDVAEELRRRVRRLDYRRRIQPVLHTPHQEYTDVADYPLFPNVAYGADQDNRDEKLSQANDRETGETETKRSPRTWLSWLRALAIVVIALIVLIAIFHPVAQVGEYEDVEAGRIVQLDGTGSRHVDWGVTYGWTATNLEFNTTLPLKNPASVNPTFIAPKPKGQSLEVKIEFSVTFLDWLVSRDMVRIEVVSRNEAPLANAGLNQTVGQGEVVTLNGSQSSDPEHDALRFVWAQTAGRIVVLGNPEEKITTFIAPRVVADETLAFRLTVTDDAGETASDEVRVVLQADDRYSINRISAGFYHTCGVRDTGAVECWGRNFESESTPPAGTFTAVSVWGGHACGVHDTGAVECWGRNHGGELTPPAGIFTAVSAGFYHTCGVRDTGAVECWGRNFESESTPPAGIFTSVSAGTAHTCGVRDTGAVECWGRPGGQSTPPAGIFTSVSAGNSHTCGLLETGTVECWGNSDYGQSTPPAGIFTSVSAGGRHTCGVRDTGAVECWGSDRRGQSTPPAGNFIAVSAGGSHTCGVREEGTVECWGYNHLGESTPPAGAFTSPAGT